MKTWEATYKGHQIRVTNGWIGGEKLYVDNELQDERIGFAFRSRLYGRIKSGEGKGEFIKVSIGGWLSMGCRIFIDDSRILS